jgi:ABC-type dipeptide transport system, periplasmic component
LTAADHGPGRRRPAGGGAAERPPGRRAKCAQRRGTLVIALDISDATGLDPVRVYQYSNPLPTHAAYDGMVTFDPGDSVNLKPALATEWAYQPDGKTVRLKLRTDVKFASGKPMTAEDVRFSFTRQLNIKDQPWQYISHIEEVKVVDPHTVDIVLKDPSLPLMTIIATPAFGVLEKEVVVAHGGTDAPDAKEKDKATEWLNENSAGTGPYRLSGWQRNQQIQMVKNPNYWKGLPVRPRSDPPHERECGAAPGHPARRRRCGVQSHSGTDRHAEGRSQHWPSRA